MARLKVNYVGRKRGKLTVMAEYYSKEKQCKMLLCECECGGFRDIPASNFLSDINPDCGCGIIDTRAAKKTMREALIKMDIQRSSFVRPRARRNINVTVEEHGKFSAWLYAAQNFERQCLEAE